MDYNFLGNDAAKVHTPPTISPDELKNISAYVDIKKQYHRNKDYYFTGKWTPGGQAYWQAPWNWTDIPRNSLERRGTYTQDKKTVKDWSDGKLGYTLRSTYNLHWKGRAFRFHNPTFYLNTLKLITDPLKYIEYLKLAPLAGFRVRRESSETAAKRAKFILQRGWQYNIDRGWFDEGYNLPPGINLPNEAFNEWWREAVTYYLLGQSFDMLRTAQIQDMYDLQAAYMNAGKLIDELKSEMLSSVPVDVQGIGGNNFRVSLALEPWQIESLNAVLKDVRGLIDKNKKKMAKRLIQLQDVDAKIVETSFTSDPLQNPYFVYNAERSREEGKPIFSNIARNASATWVPPEIAGKPENLKYWEQVPEYEKEHARVYQTSHGPMSAADMRKYGLERGEKTNWLPWIVAGAAAAYVATELL